jgi:hypothetical protein
MLGDALVEQRGLHAHDEGIQRGRVTGASIIRDRRLVELRADRCNDGVAGEISESLQHFELSDARVSGSVRLREAVTDRAPVLLTRFGALANAVSQRAIDRVSERERAGGLQARAVGEIRLVAVDGIFVSRTTG